MSFYETMSAMTARLFASDMFADATLTRVQRTFDRATQTTSSAPTTLPCRVVSKAETITGVNGEKLFQTSLTLNIEPQVDDQIKLGSQTYRVTQVVEVAPNGNPLVYHAVVKA